MKIVKGQSTESSFEVLGFDVLTSSEMKEVRGGTFSRPKSRDLDVLDMDPNT